MEAGGKKTQSLESQFHLRYCKKQNKQKNASTDVLCKYVDALCT